MLCGHASQQPLELEGCSNKLQNAFLMPALAGRAAPRGRLGASSVLPKPAPAALPASQPQQTESKEKQKTKKMKSFLGHLRFPAPQLVVFPTTTLSYFLKNVSLNEQWEGKVPNSN